MFRKKSNTDIEGELTKQGFSEKEIKKYMKSNPKKEKKGPEFMTLATILLVLVTIAVAILFVFIIINIENEPEAKAPILQQKKGPVVTDEKTILVEAIKLRKLEDCNKLTTPQLFSKCRILIGLSVADEKVCAKPMQGTFSYSKASEKGTIELQANDYCWIMMSRVKMTRYCDHLTDQQELCEAEMKFLDGLGRQ